jgi:hypothetical protein
MLQKVIAFIVDHHAQVMVTLGALVALARTIATKQHAEALKVKLPRIYALCQIIAAIAPDVVPAARAIVAAWRGAK